MEDINTPSTPGGDPSLLTMQVGLALLDLLAALKPEQEAERHKLRTRLQDAAKKANPADWLHCELLNRMQEELD